MKFQVLLFFCLFYLVSGDSGLCTNGSLTRTRSCSTQLINQDHGDLRSCEVQYFPSDSQECYNMTFGGISTNPRLGGVHLKPYMLQYEEKDNILINSVNYTVLNVTFSNIKWKTMKFRFQRNQEGSKMKNHCSTIVIANDMRAHDRSVLYYDCYWSITDSDYSGKSHILDFEATGDAGVHRGQFYFNIPSANMLSTSVTVDKWKPFTYIEIHSSTMRLHLPPPPPPLQPQVPAFRVEVIRECGASAQCDEIVKNATLKLKNAAQEVTFEYTLLNEPGAYYFLVTPLHDRCSGRGVYCQSVESPRIVITNDVHHTLNICIASVTALVVATLFAYYIVLRLIRRYWCKDDRYRLAIGNEIPPPPKILVVYSTANKLHTECVSSFVAYLRSEYGFDVLYDRDISSTSHSDPFIWAEEAYRMATHFMYIVGPADELNYYNNIYDKPIITAHKDVDTLLLSFLKASRFKCNKHILNVYFEHSNGVLPLETRHDKCFYLLKDWQKLVVYLSRNLLPKGQMMRSDKGKCLLDDLKRAKKMLNGKESVVIQCEKTKDGLDKKVLL